MVERRTRSELLEHLEDQIGFLERSSRFFDQGYESEACRIAVACRVLFHHKGQSKALLNQLRLLEALTWVDTAGLPYPDNEATTHNLTQIQFSLGPENGVIEYVPKLDNYPPSPILTRGGLQLPRGSRIPFSEWWTNPVINDMHGTEVSREDLVLAVAEKENGAHLDPKSGPTYFRLAKCNSLGWGIVVDGVMQPAKRNPVYAALRQISHEVLESIRQQRDQIAGEESA
ncbi:MAG: hypothetical protein QG671_4429 [Actinomycetota bacterium]|jgi:hypothetical protein|nr:hypothetical protein [Actinomycetota bacterium]